MTKPDLAQTSAHGRVYPWPPQEPAGYYPSVTNILNELAKPFLKPWGEKLVATYAVDNRDMWGDLPPEDAIDLLKRAPYRAMTKRGNVGTAVHAAIEAWQDADTPPVVDDLELVPYIAQATDFLSTKVHTILHAEQTIYNLTYQYAGSFDLIAKMKDGTTAIIDWKTSKNIYPETGLQLCAYTHGEFIGDTDGSQTPLPPIDTGIVVHLTEEKGWTAKYCNPNDPDLFKTFTALRRLHYYRTYTETSVYTKTEKQQ